MRHRKTKILDSMREASASAVKRITLWFAEGSVDSLVAINDTLRDAKEEQDLQLISDVEKLLLDLGIREESSSISDE